MTDPFADGAVMTIDEVQAQTAVDAAVAVRKPEAAAKRNQVVVFMDLEHNHKDRSQKWGNNGGIYLDKDDICQYMLRFKSLKAGHIFILVPVELVGCVLRQLENEYHGYTRVSCLVLQGSDGCSCVPLWCPC